jgi:acyl-coenzyme A synthetase/AMP-(fatty) acid ligase
MAKPWVLSYMEEYRDKIAILWNGRGISYSQLLATIDESVAQLREMGVQAGASVALIGDYSPRAAAFLIALIINRSIAVPLTRGSAAKGREQLFNIAEVEWVLELDEKDAFSGARREVIHAAPLLQMLREKAEPGLVLFSSGSTGESKAILHSFDRILEKFRRRRAAMRSLVFLLLDHIGGINTLLGILTSGGTAVSITERSPDSICQAIDRWQVNLLPTSPTFLRMLLMSEVYKKYDLSSLQMITYGTEPMPQATLQRLVEIFPQLKFKQTYGLSETGILPSRSQSNGSLQIKLGGEGFEAKVKNGTLWVKSASAMLGYLNHPSPFDAEGWMDTGDLVEADGEWIRIIGRKSETINVGGEKVTPGEVENVILQMDNICDVTVLGKPNPVSGSIVIARIVLHRPEEPAELKKRVQEYCLARLSRYKVPMIIEVGGVQGSERFKKIRRGD